MAQITASFDTVDKKLTVEMDGKKVKDVSEVAFFSWGEMAGVEMRSVKFDEDQATTTVTKVMANEDGTAKITETTETPSDTEDLARALFPHKKIDGV